MSTPSNARSTLVFVWWVYVCVCVTPSLILSTHDLCVPIVGCLFAVKGTMVLHSMTFDMLRLCISFEYIPHQHLILSTAANRSDAIGYVCCCTRQNYLIYLMIKFHAEFTKLQKFSTHLLLLKLVSIRLYLSMTLEAAYTFIRFDFCAFYCRY